MREIRRQDRLLNTDRSQEIIDTAEYGILSMANADGGGYGVPLNFVHKEYKTLYFHCAPLGHKLDNINADNRVTFTIVGNLELQPAKFTTLYESVMLWGVAEEVTDEQEKLEALRLIVQKYSPEFTEIGEKYIKGSFERTAIVKLTVTEITAKSKK